MSALVKKTQFKNLYGWSSKCSCSLHTQYFHFPLSCPSAILSSGLWEVVVDKEAITASQETRRVRKPAWPAAFDSWQLRRLQEWIPRPCVQSQTETQQNYLLPLAQHHLWTTTKFISSWQPKRCLWVPLGWIPALLQCQHTATLPVPTKISPNPLQSFGIVPSQSNQHDQTFPFLSQLVSNWIKVWEPEFPRLSLHLYLLSHPDLSLDAFPPAYSHIFWRSLFLFFPSRPSANWVMKSTSLNPGLSSDLFTCDVGKSCSSQQAGAEVPSGLTCLLPVRFPAANQNR